MLVVRSRNFSFSQYHPHVEMNSLYLRVRIKASFAQLPPDPALLDAAERNSDIAIVAAIDPHCSSLNLARCSVASLDISGKDCCAQTVCGVIGFCYRFFLGLEARDHSEGAKDLLTVN